jgi:hypothetical protein
MGCDKTEQPKVSEVAVTPALMIGPSASTAAAAAFPQNAAKGGFQLLNAFLSRPVLLAWEFETQVSKAFHTRVHDPSLRRMQRETGGSHPRLHKGQSRNRRQDDPEDRDTRYSAKD